MEYVKLEMSVRHRGDDTNQIAGYMTPWFADPSYLEQRQESGSCQHRGSIEGHVNGSDFQEQESMRMEGRQALG